MDARKREEAYKWAVKQIRSKVRKHEDIVATLANCAAIIKERIPHLFWVGFYFFKGDHLILGPFQGPPACVNLDINKGVCGKTARDKKTVIVDNVEEFPDHIACDIRSKSEIVVPCFNKKEELMAVLDIDSTNLKDFSTLDQKYLEEIANYLKEIWEQ